jgi:hypothetical protein
MRPPVPWAERITENERQTVRARHSLDQRLRSDGIEPPDILGEFVWFGKRQLVSSHNLAIIPQG